MAAKLLRAFDLASSDIREQIILGIAERLSDDELQCFQTARQCLGRRFDILCGVSKASGAQMPHEIQLQIVDLLDITDIYYCINVCRDWRCLLLEYRQLTDDLLKRWFPALFDEGRGKPELLHQAIRKRHLRDTGRFRSRFSCGFVKKSNGHFPVDRVEGLQRGRIFKDLACSASLHLRPPSSTIAQIGWQYPDISASDFTSDFGTASREISEHSVIKFLYADGHLAWQLTPVPGEWAQSIIVHDLRAHRRWDLSLPSMRTRGIKLNLWALGRDLVVARAVGERVLYAWDLMSHAVDRITLQNPPNRCYTRYRSVVIVTHSGELLLWSFGQGLTNINTAMPQDEGDYQGPTKPKSIPRTPLSAFEIQNSRIMFHPRDEDVFFLATFDDRNLGPAEFLMLWVYEFRNKRCCRIFTYSVPPERRLWIVFGAQKIDAHGTYQLLEQENPTVDGVQFSSVTFNTINRSFGSLRFQTPRDTHCDTSLVWNGQLILEHANPETPSMRTYPLVALGHAPNTDSLKAATDAVSETQRLERAMESMMTSISSPSIVDRNMFSSQRTRTAIEELEQDKAKYGIVRTPYVSDSKPNLGSAIGLRYALSLFGGQCNGQGHHSRDCPRASDLPSPELDTYPINYFAHRRSRDEEGVKAREIVGDDEFLVVITNRNYFTAFAVDEDGKIAEAMRGNATDSVEQAPHESSKDAVS